MKINPIKVSCDYKHTCIHPLNEGKILCRKNWQLCDKGNKACLYRKSFLNTLKSIFKK